MSVSGNNAMVEKVGARITVDIDPAMRQLRLLEGGLRSAGANMLTQTRANGEAVVRQEEQFSERRRALSYRQQENLRQIQQDGDLRRSMLATMFHQQMVQQERDHQNRIQAIERQNQAAREAMLQQSTLRTMSALAQSEARVTSLQEYSASRREALQRRTEEQERRANERHLQLMEQSRRSHEERLQQLISRRKPASDKGLEETAKIAGVAFGIMATATTLATIEAAKMEQQMGDLNAVTDATTQQLREAKEAAENFGPQNGFFASDTVGAITEFNKAGVDMARLVKGEIKDAQDLVTGGMISVSDAAGIASYSLNTYKKDMLSIKDVADIQIGAANASSTSVKEMADANRMLGPVAADLGVKYQELNTSLAIFANNGLRGSDAGTSLKTSLLQLAAPTDEQRRVMKDLNLQFFDSQGKMKSLAEISEILQNKLSGYNDQARTTILSTLAGTDGVRALSILARSGAEEFEKMSESMSKVSAADVAATRLDTVSGSLKKLQAEVALAGDKFGAEFLPAVNDVTSGLTSMVQAYNNLSPQARESINTFIMTTTAMSGTAAGLAITTNAVSKLSKAVGGLTGALTLLEKHPVILSLTVLAGVATMVYSAYQRNAEAAREFKQAQDELNASIAEAGKTTDAQKLKQHDDEREEILRLGKQYEELHARREEIMQQLTKLTEENKANGREASALRSELKQTDEAYKNLSESMNKLGVTGETYKQVASDLEKQINANAAGLLSLSSAKVDEIAKTQDQINHINSLKDEYNKLSSSESLNAEQKARLSEVSNELKGLIPGLIVVTDEHGRALIQNTSLIDDKVLATQKAIEADTAWANTTVDKAVTAAETEAKIIQQRLDNIIAFAEAVNSLSSQTVELDGGDNHRERNAKFAESEEAAIRAQQAKNNVILSEAKNAKDRIKSGNFDSNRPQSGGKSYEVPKADRGDKDKSAEELAREADQARRDSYEREMADQKQKLERGLINHQQYADGLKEIESRYSDWLNKHSDERYSIENDRARSSYQHSVEWIEQRKKAMIDAGVSAQAVADFEVDAWSRVAARDIYLAEDRKQAQEELARAKKDSAAASFQHSVEWIENEKQEMRDAGKSELEIAQTTYDAWTRVAQRKSYNADDAKRAAEEQKQAYSDLVDVLKNDLKKAREMERDAAIKAEQDAQDAAEKAIDVKIKGLESQAQAQKYLNDLKKEEQTLNELLDQRNKVAEDKRFDRVERDENGNLVVKHIADIAKLDELDKKIAEQRDRIAGMKRDEEVRQKREQYEKERTDLQDANKKKMESMREYWNQMTSEERITQDIRVAVAKDGLEKTLENVRTYTNVMVAEAQRAQQEILRIGGLSLPEVGSLEPPLTAGGMDKIKDYLKKAGQVVGSIGDRLGLKLPRIPGTPIGSTAKSTLVGDRASSVQSTPQIARLQPIMEMTKAPVIEPVSIQMVYPDSVAAAPKMIEYKPTFNISSNSPDPRVVANLVVQHANQGLQELMAGVRKLR